MNVSWIGGAHVHDVRSSDSRAASARVNPIDLSGSTCDKGGKVMIAFRLSLHQLAQL